MVKERVFSLSAVPDLLAESSGESVTGCLTTRWEVNTALEPVDNRVGSGELPDWLSKMPGKSKLI